MTVSGLIIRFVAGIILTVGLAAAQTTRGELNGRVVDASGAVIPGARVEALNPATGVTLETTANDSGQYVIFLPFGRYELRMKAQGFGETRVSNVVISTASITTLNVELKVRTIAEEVSVVATATTLETNDSTVGTGVEEKLLRDVPVPVAGQKRRPYQYIALAPGVNSTNGRNEIVGSRTGSTVILLDGLSTETLNTGLGEAAVSTEPSVEAIGEFKLLLNSTPAEYGRTTGAVITYATKSGTNDLHGSAWEYLNNSALNARPWAAATRGKSRSNEFGLAAGGPVYIPRLYNGHNKTFFWSTLTFFRQGSTGAAGDLMTVPTAAMRQGDFSFAGINTIYDRSNPYTDPNGQVRFQPFPNNRLPLSRKSKVSSYFENLIPLPNSGSGPELNFVGASGTTFNPWDITAKVDHLFTEKHRVAGFYQYGTQPRVSTDPALGATFGNSNFNQFHRTRIDYSWVAKPNLVHTVLFGINRNFFGSQRANFGQNVGLAAGIKGMPDPNCPEVILARSSPGQFTICGGSPATTSSDTIWNLNYSTLWNKGRHTIKWGYQSQFWIVNRLNLGGASGGLTVSAAGSYQYGSGASVGQNTRDTNSQGGFHLADFYLGLPTFVGTASALNRREREQYHALYIQDDWKVTPKLTINAGLRWDLNVPFSEKNAQYTGFDPTRPNPGASNRLGALTFFGDGPGRNGISRIGDIHYNDWGPRLGLAYQIDRKTVFRAGAGIQQSAIQNTNVDFVNRTGFQSAGTPAPNPNPYGIYFHWDSPFPQEVLGTIPNTDPTFRNNQDFVNWMARDTVGRSAELYFLSAGFQRQFGSWVLETTYFGNLTRHASDHEKINDLPPQFRKLGALLNQPISSAQVRAAGFSKPYAEFPDDQPLFRALRPYPQYNNISNDAGVNTGGNYNAFTFKATRRYSNGLSFLGHWTIAKNLGDTDWSPGAFGSSSRDQYNRKLDKKLERFDTPHRVVLNYSYELPFGPGKKLGGTSAASKYVLGGWTVSGIHEYVGGFPMDMTGGLSVPIPGGLSQFSNRVVGVPIRSSLSCGELEFRNPAKNYLLNAGNPAQAARTGRPLAFTPEGDYQQGNAPQRDQETRQCPNFNENLSMQKMIPFRERLHLQLGADCLNCLNRHRWVSFRTGQNITSQTFGEIQPEQIGGPRVFQMRMRIQW